MGTLHGLLFGVMGLVLLFYNKLAASRCKYFVITPHEAGRLYCLYFTYTAVCNTALNYVVLVY